MKLLFRIADTFTDSPVAPALELGGLGRLDAALTIRSTITAYHHLGLVP